MNEAVAKWTLSGRVFAWRYKGCPRAYSGWHMTADRSGCESLLQLIELMASSNYSSRTRFPLSRPGDTELGVPNAPHEHRGATSMELLHSPTKMLPEHWHLTESSESIHLEFSRAMLDELRQGIIDISQNKGDYCIGPDGHELWFWWI